MPGLCSGWASSGEPFRRFIEGHLVLLLPLITFLLLGGFLLLRYL